MKYKTVKKLVPWCDKCGKEIRGDGSSINPLKCDCGKWKHYKGKHRLKT